MNALGDARLLLEREEELRNADSALRMAERGAGSVLVVEGPAGIGKTSLLAAISRRAQHRGLSCLRAAAGERERELEWTVVRGLLAGTVAGMSDASRAELERGPARLAFSLLDDGAVAAVPSDPGALLYGLYWLVVELASETPVFLGVDDAHWADEASLRWLEYLGARVNEVGVVLAVGRRTDSALVQLQALAAQDGSRVLQPTPLSPQGCGRVLAGALASSPDQPFTDACWGLTAGNPFLLNALASWLGERGVEPVAAELPRLAEARPRDVERWVMVRLQGLPRPALEVAQATAVLGGTATLGRVAVLVRAALRDVADAAAMLQRVGILEEGGERSALPLPTGGHVRFAHPMLRSVVYESMPAFVRIALHTQAARELEREGASAAAVAQQLMFTEPAGDVAVVEILRSAAAEAMASGSPAIATARLTRALAEPPALADLAKVLHELGRAEAAAAIADAIEHLERAYDEARSTAQRGLIAEDLALCLVVHGRLEDSVRVARASITELYEEAGKLDGDEMFRLGALYVTTSSYLRRGSQARAWLGSLGAAPAADTPGGRLLLVAYSQQAMTSGESITSVGELSERALDGGKLLEELGPESSPVWSAVTGLIIACRYAVAEKMIGLAIDAAQRCGSSIGFALALSFSALLAHRRGRLSEAIADARQAMAILGDGQLATIYDYAAAFLAHALIDAGELEMAASELDAMPLDDPPQLAPYAVAVSARGRLRLVRGDAEGALLDQRRVESLAGMERFTPAVLSWRSQAALALMAMDRQRQAAQLAAQEIKLARRSGSAWAEGLALHAAGVIAADADGVALLGRAAEVLENLGAAAEQARALIDLGSLADRNGESREQALEWLRQGLDLADRCGAALTADRAQRELVARGARPRRRRLSGAEALTPMERRVAERAATGVSNREIARDLFLSLRTVESHLTSSYRKLRIGSRAELTSALSHTSRPQQPSPRRHP